jgi:hypothetical protein
MISTSLLRPFHWASLPHGVTYEYVTAPQFNSSAYPAVRELPMSKYRYGTAKLSRELTPAECNQFDLRKVDAE